jgi:hypothetical protein
MLTGALALLLWQSPAVPEALRRTSEEADIFAQQAIRLLTTETLKQRALKAPPRFRPRFGEVKFEPRYQAREIVSEYGYSSLSDAPDRLHEFRRVTTVDGRVIERPEKARDTLTMGVKSEDDRLKKRLLRDFEKHGLVGAATDFGQLILLFRGRSLGQYEFRPAGSRRLGADNVLVFAFIQREGPQRLTIFEEREAHRVPLTGEIWVRDSDGLPLRVTLKTQRKIEDRILRDEASVDYSMSSHGVIVPVSVVHRQYSGELLVVENLFQYSPFRRFGAQADIKFEVQEPPK